MELPSLQPHAAQVEDASYNRLEAGSTQSSGRSRFRKNHSSTADGSIKSFTTSDIMHLMKQETGFDSYKTYLESLESDPVHSRSSWWDYKYHHVVPTGPPHLFSIIDLSVGDDLLPVAQPRCELSSATETFQYLREPPQGVEVQLLLWSSKNLIDPDFQDTLGLGLGLEPCFFEALCKKSGQISTPWLYENPFATKYFNVARNVITIARKCPLIKSGYPPIVFIAGSFGSSFSQDGNLLYHLMHEIPLPYNLRQSSDQLSFKSVNEHVEMYARLLTIPLKQNWDTSNLLFNSLLPLLRIEILRLRRRSRAVPRTFDNFKRIEFYTVLKEIDDDQRYFPISDDNYEITAVPIKLYKWRDLLRYMIGHLEDAVEPLAVFLSSQISPDSIKSPAYYQLVQERESILKEASRLEAEMRDFLQLEASQLSLLESKKSIEVSNSQLQENKRGKYL